MMKFIAPDNMFRGKFLPCFLKQYSMHYLMLVEIHGLPQVRRTYDWCFRTLQKMHWGQYICIEKICPDRRNRGLLFWCMECIYQSDFLSQMEFRREKNDKGEWETRLYIIEPTDEQKRLWDGCLTSDRRYILIDWYNRILSDPHSNPDVKPEWLGITIDACNDSDVDAGVENYTEETD